MSYFKNCMTLSQGNSVNTASTLFILDDDYLVSQTLERFGRSSGFKTARFEHADPFFNAVTESPPDVIVLDLFLPDIDGIEALRHLSSLQCHSKIIVVSGAEDKIIASAARLAYSLGLNLLGCLAKPFSLYKFRKILKVAPTPVANISRRPTSKSLLTVELLRRAIAEDKIEAYYQPKMFTQNGQLAGFELLSRWVDDRLGFIPPDRFIVLAEQNDLINALSLNVIKHGLRWFKSVSHTFYHRFPDRKEDKRLSLSINISATSLTDSSFFEELTQLCLEEAIPTSDIILELTETGAMADPVASLSQLTRLRMQGFFLSIDDFGTGFSSMQQLVNMPFSELKIDKSFVLNLEKSKEKLKVVRGIINLAHSLEVCVTAEGVETPAVWSILEKLGCDKVQGFYFAKPLPAQQIWNWLIDTLPSFRKNL